MKIKSLFNWEIPSNVYDPGLVHCSRKMGGCGRWHEFAINNSENYFIDFDWEARECEKFSFWLEKEVRKEWEEEICEQFIKNVVVSEVTPRQEKGAVSIKDTQWEKEFGAVRPVGYWKKRLTSIFTCGNCSVEVKGAGKHGIAKNRNDPKFWGLETEEKILCLKCIMTCHYKDIGTWRKRGKLKEYLKRGYK